MKYATCLLGLLLNLTYCVSQPATPIKQRFTKLERMIPMRDGVRLFTAIYIPKDVAEKLPFLLMRTPYSCSPYGEENYPGRLGPSSLFAAENYIYAMQDVRGRYKSEGTFEEMTPHQSKLPKAVNESTDAFDTIEWLLKQVANNNGNVGMYGISYPGFYASAALPNAHPALKAVSPQAPVTDEFEGDDAYHGGAFFLMDNFNFLNDFDHPRDTPWTRYPRLFDVQIADAYDFYLKLGPIKNANEQYYKNRSKIWNEYLQHDTKDEYWQARDIRKHFKNIKPAVLVVGGWYDAEDLFGALKTYHAIEKGSPGNNNKLIMGPWTHGGWARNDWSRFGGQLFGSNTSRYFQQIEFEFFNSHLKGKGAYKAAEATIFETGTNQWKEHASWPPAAAVQRTWYLNSGKQLLLDKTANLQGQDMYVSDPADPVPYIGVKGGGRNNEYMVADQSFAAARPDVLVYTSPTIDKNITLAGPITANLYITTNSTDLDFVVKVIDVLPDTATDASGKSIGGMQRLIRADVLRGKFRNSFSKPEPFVPGKVTKVELKLNDVAHTFLPGHKIMVQVQSSWFPLVDRNPQKFLSIPKATASDFTKATISIHHTQQNPSSITVWQLDSN